MRKRTIVAMGLAMLAGAGSAVAQGDAVQSITVQLNDPARSSQVGWTIDAAGRGSIASGTALSGGHAMPVDGGAEGFRAVLAMLPPPAKDWSCDENATPPGSSERATIVWTMASGRRTANLFKSCHPVKLVAGKVLKYGDLDREIAGRTWGGAQSATARVNQWVPQMPANLDP